MDRSFFLCIQLIFSFEKCRKYFDSVLIEMIDNNINIIFFFTILKVHGMTCDHER